MKFLSVVKFLVKTVVVLFVVSVLTIIILGISFYLSFAKDKHEIDVCFGGDTVLHFAARKGMPDVASLLLEYGADTTILNDNGKTALDLAIESGVDSEDRRKTIELLKN